MALNPIRMQVLYEQIADWMIANPGARVADAAVAFNRSDAWLSKITNSPVFRSILAERQKSVSAKLEEKLVQVSLLGLSRLEKALADTSVPLPMDEVRETTSMALGRLGYGSPKSGAAVAGTTNIQNNIFVVEGGELAEARARMAKLGHG